MGNLGGGFKADQHRNTFPEGRFTFIIAESNMIEATKDGMKIGLDWEFKLKCVTTTQMNRQMTRRMAYERPGCSDSKALQQLQIGGVQIGDICRAVGVLEPKDTKDLVNKKFDATVTIKGDFNNLTKITAHVPPLVTTPPVAKPTVTPQADGSVSKPEDWGDEAETNTTLFVEEDGTDANQDAIESADAHYDAVAGAQSNADTF